MMLQLPLILFLLILRRSSSLSILRRVWFFSYLPESTSAGLDAAVFVSLVFIEATHAATQPAVTSLFQKSSRSESSLTASSLASSILATSVFASSLSTAPSFIDPPIVTLAELPASTIFAAQPSPPALTLLKGSTIQILLHRLARQAGEYYRFDEAFSVRNARLKALHADCGLRWISRSTAVGVGRGASRVGISG